MHLLQAGVDISVIALWLGHANPVTTHQYIEADLAMKEQCIRTQSGRPQKALWMAQLGVQLTLEGAA